MNLSRKLASVAASAALALAGAVALASPAAADIDNKANSQYAHIDITHSNRSGYYIVRVYGRINIPAFQNVTVYMRLKGDDWGPDPDLGVTASAPAVQTIEDPPGTGSFSMSVEVPGSTLDEDWGDDEIYAHVSATTGWEGNTENHNGSW
jgi:hypothetical protein